MSDTLHPFLIDVTNSNATSLVPPSKDNTLSSQDDADQIPQLSSPSSVSTMSSPSSLLVEITATANPGKRPYPTVSPTCSSLEPSEIDQHHQYIQSTSSTTVNDASCDGESIGSANNQVDFQQYRCRYCGSTDSIKWTDMPFGINTCCQECYTDQCTPKTSVIDTTCSDTTALKRRRLDEDTQQQNHLDMISTASTTTEPQDLHTVLSSQIPASSQPTMSSLIVPSTLTSSLSSNIPSTSTDDPSISIDTLSTTAHHITPSTKTSRFCLECKDSDPPLWRNGPDGKKTLCNACGIRYSKFLRGVLSDWHRITPPPNAQKKKRNRKPPSEETTTTTDSTASISSATSLVKKKNSTVAGGGNTSSETRLKKSDTLHERKTYLEEGMHSGGFRMMDSVPFTFSLPLHQGSILLNTERDFELPLDIMEEYESGRLFGWTDYSSSKKPPRYIRILHNSYVERKARKEEHKVVCHCIPSASGIGCGDDCLNRMMFFECDPSTCPCGDLCSNQSFRKRQFVKGLKVYLTEGRGWGIMTKEFIQQGTLITEYRGEIISDKTCQERRRTVYKHQKNFYFLDYHKGEVIDACSKGSEARFINHGCDPNCHIEKWSRNGEFHLGVFASKDIPIDTELFYDYNFSLFDTEAIGQECRCGSSNCRGFLGKRPSHPRKIVNS